MSNPNPPPDQAYADFCCELLGAAGPCRARRMFGGHGLYCDGLMIGLIAGGQLYLKTDATSLPRWQQAGSRPFVYEGKGRPVVMSYWTPPAEAMESPALMSPWARLALEAALRAAQGKQPRAAAAARPPRTQPASTRGRRPSPPATTANPATATPRASRSAAAKASASGARKPPTAARKSSRRP